MKTPGYYVVRVVQRISKEMARLQTYEGPFDTLEEAKATAKQIREANPEFEFAIEHESWETGQGVIVQE